MKGDGVVPISSQELQRKWLSKGANYIKPYPAPEANHFTELKPTKDVNIDLKIIFKRAHVGE